MANSKAAIFLSVALLMLSLLIVHVVESRVLPKSKSVRALAERETSLICDQTYGAEAGDSCFTVSKAFNLTSDFFSAINPNLDCKKIFIGQWLCIDGFTV
ncbi:hypothetical protein ABFS83_13G025300 [Erythranthe nasuta]